jgi:hypothetical protein
MPITFKRKTRLNSTFVGLTSDLNGDEAKANRKTSLANFQRAKNGNGNKFSLSIDDDRCMEAPVIQNLKTKKSASISLKGDLSYGEW